MKGNPLANLITRFRMPRRSTIEINVTRLSGMWSRENRPLIWRSPRLWLAWCLRGVADRLDGTASYTYQGSYPAVCRPEEWKDAISFGTSAMGRYLTDIEAERRMEIKYGADITR